MASIAQRLVAAGATPERARAFERQFIAARPGLKKQDIEDAFDEDLAAASAALFPKSFRPPRTGDVDYEDYARLVLGPSYDAITRRVAPNYSAAEAGWSLQNDPEQFTFSQLIVDEIKGGTPLAEAKQIAKNVAGKFKLTSDVAEKEVENLYTEAAKIPEARDKALSSDKYYKAGLPDPKLKYGVGTDLKRGTVSFRTLPGVDDFIMQETGKVRSQLEKTYGAAGPQSSAAAGIAAPETLAQEVFKKLPGNQTPFKDEVKRRQFLKDKKLK